MANVFVVYIVDETHISERFEPADIPLTTGKAASPAALNPTWLSNLGDIINTKIEEILDIQSILNVLEDFNYMGMMKERWEEIKRLQPPNLAIAQEGLPNL